MSVPMLERCCFCLSLHTGTLIIGYLFTIVAVLELFIYTMIVTLRPLGPGGEELSTHKFAFFVATAIVSFVQLLCGILLIIGATKKRASLTLPWTIVTGILAAVFFVLCLTAISLILQDTGDVLGEDAFMISFHLLRACVSIYCVVVVHSRHKQIMNEKNESRFQHSARLYSPVSSAFL